MIQVTINEKPLSSNQVWQGRRFKTKKYQDYEKLLLTILPKKNIQKGLVELTYRFHLKNHKTTDYDNLIKPLQDILVKKGYIEDDRFIYKATIEKIPSKEDKIEIWINSYKT